MTLSTALSRVDVLGNGSATIFSFAPVVIFAATDLQVTLRNAAGTETTLALGSGSANFSQSVTTFPGTGSITYPASGGSPIPTGSSLTIKRVVPILQTTDLSNQGPYLAEVLETALDYDVAIVQQQQEQLNRTLQLAASDPSVNLPLPTSVQRANQLLGFDSFGNPIAAQPSSAIVSSVMQPFVDSATLSAARVALGINSAIDPLLASSSLTAVRTLIGAIGRNWTASNQPTLGDVIEKAVTGTNILIHCYGDSLTEGYNAIGGGGTINSGLTLAAIQYPMALQAALAFPFASLSVATVQNFGFSGDTTKQGYDRWGPGGGAGILAGRWTLAQVVPDVAIISFGYNDANGYGGTFGSIAECRAYTALWIERFMALGSVPILLLQGQISLVADNQKFQPYRDAQIQIALEYGVLAIDANDCVGWKTDRWTDGVHMTAAGYNEQGWSLASLFNVYAGRSLIHVGTGRTLWPEDWMQAVGGAGGALFPFVGARTGNLLAINPGKVASLGVYCEDDVYPLITTYNSGGAVVRNIDIYYAGNGSGVPIISIKSPGAGEVRERVVGPLLHRGFRQLGFLVPGADIGFIESIEFVGASQAVSTPQAGDRKSALSGISSHSMEAGDWTAVDYGRVLTPSFKVEFRGTIPVTGLTGISFTIDHNQDNKSGSPNQYMVLRSGDALIVRLLAAGVATDFTSAAFFSFVTGVDYVGPLVITNSATGTLDVRRVGGTGGALGGGVPTGVVYPGLIVIGGSNNGIQCVSFMTRD